jgi:hypothetical protein
MQMEWTSLPKLYEQPSKWSANIVSQLSYDKCGVIVHSDSDVPTNASVQVVKIVYQRKLEPKHAVDEPASFEDTVVHYPLANCVELYPSEQQTPETSDIDQVRSSS